MVVCPNQSDTTFNGISCSNARVAKVWRKECSVKSGSSTSLISLWKMCIRDRFYTMADSMFVGRFVGEDALAAVGASYSLTTVFISIAIGGGVGASVLTSQHFGARQYERCLLYTSTADAPRKRWRPSTK